MHGQILINGVARSVSTVNIYGVSKLLMANSPLCVIILVFLRSTIVSLSLTLAFTSSLVPFGVVSFSLVFLLANLTGLLLSSWMGIIIFLVYIGGLMVMFAYFLAICPNQLVEFKKFTIRGAALVVVLGLLFFKVQVTVPQWRREGVSIAVLFAQEGVPLLLLLARVLFLTLVVVVKIVDLRRGPLRPFGKRKNEGKFKFTV